MPGKKSPSGEYTAADLIRWLGQVADDRQMSPVATRAAVTLAAKFAAGAPCAVLTARQLADQMQVGLNTVARSLTSLRQRGHLMSSRGGGHALEYRPVLKFEATR